MGYSITGSGAGAGTGSGSNLTIEEGCEKIKAAWEKEFGIPYPRTDNDAMRLASRIGLPSEQVYLLQFNLSKVIAIFEGQLQRRRDIAVDRRNFLGPIDVSRRDPMVHDDTHKSSSSFTG